MNVCDQGKNTENFFVFGINIQLLESQVSECSTEAFLGFGRKFMAREGSLGMDQQLT